MDNDLLQTVANNDELQGDIQDMKNRTRLEGTAVGALTGFVIGSFSDDTNVKVASSLIGAATGLIAGEYVAHKKAEYANEEAYLDACIDEAERYNQVARESNKNLRKQICRKEKIIESLQHQIANGVECQKHIEEEFEDTKEKQKAVDEIIQGLESELIAQQKAINTISDADLRQVNKLQAEMEVTKSELRELKSQRQQLTNIMFEMSEMTV
jgi:chromosome segregation ATPase